MGKISDVGCGIDGRRGFFNDVRNAYSLRQKVPGAPSSRKTTNDDIVKYDRTFVEQEVSFADRYRNAVFENMDIQYLCRKYVNGVYMQLNAEKAYGEQLEALILQLTNIDAKRKQILEEENTFPQDEEPAA